MPQMRRAGRAAALDALEAAPAELLGR
jgi:hypothetical protein